MRRDRHNTPAENVAIAAYLVVVWIGVTFFAHHAYDWGFVHAALAAVVPAIVVGGLLILAVGIAVAPLGLVWLAVTTARDWWRDRRG